MKKFLLLILSVSLIFFLYSCDNSTEPTVKSDGEINTLSKKGGNAIADQLQSMMTAMNKSVAASGSNYRVVMAEYITNGENGEMGNTVLQKDVGNKQLSFDFVPFDARRAWSGPVDGENDNITYAIDQTGDAVPLFGGLTGAQTDAIIEAAMSTWDEANCSNLELTRNPDYGLDIGYAAGSPYVFADVQHAGFNFYLGSGVLGVTFTWGFTSGGDFTDVDNNGKFDCAFREIYYSSAYGWTDDGTGVDLETVALHEAGHGLSQIHNNY